MYVLTTHDLCRELLHDPRMLMENYDAGPIKIRGVPIIETDAVSEGFRIVVEV